MKDELLFKLVGKRVRQLREEREWTQEELSRRFAFNYKHYQRIEQGQQNLELATMNKLAIAFETSIQSLLEFDTVKPKRAPKKARKIRKAKTSEGK